MGNIESQDSERQGLYDAMYLFSIATPDYNYLSFKAGVNNIQELKTRLELKIQSINLKELIRM